MMRFVSTMLPSRIVIESEGHDDAEVDFDNFIARYEEARDDNAATAEWRLEYQVDDNDLMAVFEQYKSMDEPEELAMLLNYLENHDALPKCAMAFYYFENHTAEDTIDHIENEGYKIDYGATEEAAYQDLGDQIVDDSEDTGEFSDLFDDAFKEQIGRDRADYQFEFRDKIFVVCNND